MHVAPERICVILAVLICWALLAVLRAGEALAAVRKLQGPRTQ